MLHRDDIPFEKVEELEKQIREATGNPNQKIFFPGDMSEKDIPKDILEKIKYLEKVSEDSVNRGFCIDCYQAMPIYRPWEEGWEEDEGWMCLIGPDDEPSGWLCKDCIEMMNDEDEIDENERWTITDELEGDFE